MFRKGFSLSAHVFIPRLERDLQQFQSAWNLHPLSSEHCRSPNQLWVEGMHSSANSGLTCANELFHAVGDNASSYDLNVDGLIHTNTDAVVVPEDDVSHEQRHLLEASFDP